MHYENIVYYVLKIVRIMQNNLQVETVVNADRPPMTAVRALGGKSPLTSCLPLPSKASNPIIVVQNWL